MKIEKVCQAISKTNLHLVKYNLTQDALTQTVREPTNHIWIYDRSGSMYGLLDKLVEDLIVRAKQIPLGDTITIGWFSSEGQKNFVLKGFKVTEERDYSLLEKALRQNNTTLGCTCFSEILHDASQVVTDLSIFSSKFSLCFLTDGYPVVSSYTRELKEIDLAVAKLNGTVTASLLVGYGDYYNKQLMSDMAEKLGGSLTHAANLPNFSVTLTEFISGTENSKRYPLKLDEEDVILVYNLQGSNINLYSPNANNEINLTWNDTQETLYVLTSKPTAPETAGVDLSKGLYAAAFLLTQRCKTDVALEVLGFLGDKHLIDLVTNSYTNAEYGKAEAEIKQAALHEDKRYLEGKKSNYVAPADAFCLLDLMDVLTEDSEAYFYPRHEEFEYKRIGKPAVREEGFPEFKDDKSSRTLIRDFVWNETKLNLSLRSKITGTVSLPAEALKYGLLPDFPSFQYRNYAIVKDGILNVTRLPASVSEETFKVLKDNKIVRASTWEKDRVYVLNLDAIPVVNRKIAEGKTSATSLCKLIIQEHGCKAVLKALKWFKDRDFPEKAVTAETATSFIEKQQAFLESQGINTKTGAYEPPTKKEESTDFYYAKEFSIKIKGLSSLPKIEVVAEKVKASKKLTASDTLVAVGIGVYESLTGADKKKAIEEAIRQQTDVLKAVRRQIQETKFSVLLGKRWFNEFSSREENTLKIDGYDITVALTETKVDI